MKKAKLSREYETNFCVNYLPKTFLDFIITKLNKKESKSMLAYINKNYNISKSELIFNIKKNLELSKIDSKVTLSFNSNVYIKKIKFINILKLINDGNLEIKGTNIFNDAADFITINANKLYEYYAFQKGVILWR